MTLGSLKMQKNKEKCFFLVDIYIINTNEMKEIEADFKVEEITWKKNRNGLQSVFCLFCFLPF